MGKWLAALPVLGCQALPRAEFGAGCAGWEWRWALEKGEEAEEGSILKGKVLRWVQYGRQVQDRGSIALSGRQTPLPFQEDICCICSSKVLGLTHELGAAVAIRVVSVSAV